MGLYVLQSFCPLGFLGMPCELQSKIFSTSTLIDGLGLVKMEVGMDDLTSHGPDLAKELQRLKDNSLKFPKPKNTYEPFSSPVQVDIASDW